MARIFAFFNPQIFKTFSRRNVNFRSFQYTTPRILAEASVFSFLLPMIAAFHNSSFMFLSLSVAQTALRVVIALPFSR